MHRYLMVEKIRFGGRLSTEEVIDEAALTCLIPPLTLQPLVENAIVHGVAHLPEGTCIRLNSSVTDNQLLIVIENSFDPEFKSKKRSGIGLANVRERIETRYGKKGSFLAAADGDCFCATISLPAERSAT